MDEFLSVMGTEIEGIEENEFFMEFPTKNMGRAIRRKRDFSKGQSRFRKLQAILGNFSSIDMFSESYMNKLNSVHSKSKNKMEFKLSYFRTVNNILFEKEKRACDRRKAEAMAQRESLYYCGIED